MLCFWHFCNLCVGVSLVFLILLARTNALLVYSPHPSDLIF